MSKVFIIAEAGVNHNGSMELAKKLIDVAVEAKADAVKFQTYIAEKVMTKDAKKAEYQVKLTGKQESQLEMVKKIQLSFNDFRDLQEYSQKKGILFLSTPFDLDSVDFLASLNLPIMKLPSGEINNLPYLRRVGKLSKEVILSCGMATLGEIENAIQILEQSGTPREKISILHCNTEYPTPMQDVNLKAMITIRDAFKIKVGYSDHTLGIEVPVAAVALGAQIIEKHFTLDKNMEGPDHRASLEPDELVAMVSSIRNIEQALGNGIKKPSASETKNINVARRSVFFSKKLKAGHVIKEDDLIMKRPGNGVSPLSFDSILGTKLIKDVDEDEMFKWNHISY